MEKVASKKILLILVVLMMVLAAQPVFSWTINDPEIKDLSGMLVVRDWEGSEEFTLYFVYLNDRSMNYFWDSDVVETVKQRIGDCNCLFLSVITKQDTFFWPTSITFVQGNLQYDIGYDDVMKVSDTFSGNLRSGVSVFGLIFIPESINVYSPMKIYYDEDYTIFSVPKEKEELTIEEQIKRLEREKSELEERISESQKRINEILQELEELRKG